jgi:hypothetical protein
MDQDNYERIYNNIDSSTSIGFIKAQTNSLSKIESFYAVLAIIEKQFCGAFELFIFIYAFISISIKFKAFKKLSPYIFLTLLLYCSNYFFKDLSQMRNAMNSGIILLALPYAVNKSFFKYFALIYFAIINHTFGVIALPIYFYRYFITKVRLIGMIIIFFSLNYCLGGLKQLIAVLSFSLDIESNRIAGRVMQESIFMIESGYFSISNILFLFISVFLIVNINRLKKSSKYSEILIFTFIYGFSCFFLFHDLGIVASRFVDTLCIPVLCVLLPIIAKSYKGYIKIMIIMFIFLYSFYSIYIAHFNNIMTYQSLL